MRYPPHLLRLIETFKKLPGVGSRSAERFAFELLRWPAETLKTMGELIGSTPQQLAYCPSCGALSEQELCLVCRSPHRDPSKLCIVAFWRDLFSIESTGEYRGLYHVLGALISPLEGIEPASLPLPLIKSRIKDLGIKEIIIALDATLEGDTTSLYLKQQFESYDLEVSRLAFGIPMGSSLEYVDSGTLARAFSSRSLFN